MDKVLNMILVLGAVIGSGLLCSFLVILGLNKRKVWKAFGRNYK